MGNLTNSLFAVTEAMRTIQQAIDVGGNNVTNAKSPGYVKQRLGLVAKRFEIETGLPGGVDSSGLISSRKQYLEQAVRDQSEKQGRLAQRTADLERLEPIFDVSGSSGIANALDEFFESFSELAVNPNDGPSREMVIQSARNLSQSFQFTAEALKQESTNVTRDMRHTVNNINRLGELLRGFNEEIRNDTRALDDAGLDAQIHAALEELSELADFNVLRAEDGSYTVYLGEQIPLVIGDHHFEVSLDTSTPQLVVRDFEGKDVTGAITQGRAAALIDHHNNYLPSVLADLNLLAGSFADQVNAQLASGLDRNGQPGAPMFTYDPLAGAAASISVTGITADQIAAASANGAEGNGNALTIAEMSVQSTINDSTFSEFYGLLAGSVGSDLANSRDDLQTQELLLSQARNVRAAETAVSYDEEAVYIVEFQRAYQANAELVRIINSLTEELIGIMR